MPNNTLLSIQADQNSKLLNNLTIKAQELSELSTSINGTLESISPLIPTHYQADNSPIPTAPTAPNLSNIDPNDDKYIESLATFHQKLTVFNNLINNKLEHLSFHSTRIGFDSNKYFEHISQLHPSHASSESEFSGVEMQNKLTFGKISPKDLSDMLLDNNVPVPSHFSDKDIEYLLPLYESLYLSDNEVVSDSSIDSKRADVEFRMTEMEMIGLHSKDTIDEYKLIANELNELKSHKSIIQDKRDMVYADLTKFAHTDSNISIPSDSKDNLSYDANDINLLKKIERAHYLLLGHPGSYNQFSLNRFQDKSNTFLDNLDSSLALLLDNDHTFKINLPTSTELHSEESNLIRVEEVITELNKTPNLTKYNVQDIVDVSDVLLGRTKNSEAIFNLNDTKKNYFRDVPKYSVLGVIIVDAYDVDNDNADKIIDTIDSYLLNNGTKNSLTRINPMLSPEDIVDITARLESIKDEVRSSSNPIETLSRISDEHFYNKDVRKDVQYHLSIHNSSDRTPTNTNQVPYDGINYLIKKNDSPEAHTMSFAEAVKSFSINFNTKPDISLLLNGKLDGKVFAKTMNGQHENMRRYMKEERKLRVLEKQPNNQVLQASFEKNTFLEWIDSKNLNPFSNPDPISLATSFDQESNTFRLERPQNT